MEPNGFAGDVIRRNVMKRRALEEAIDSLHSPGFRDVSVGHSSFACGGIRKTMLDVQHCITKSAFCQDAIRANSPLRTIDLPGSNREVFCAIDGRKSGLSLCP